MSAAAHGRGIHRALLFMRDNTHCRQFATPRAVGAEIAMNEASERYPGIGPAKDACSVPLNAPVAVSWLYILAGAAAATALSPILLIFGLALAGSRPSNEC